MHHPLDADYASGVSGGLNRFGYQVWSQQRDAVYGDDLKDFERAALRAAIIVSVETASFREWDQAAWILEYLDSRSRVERPKYLKIVDGSTYQSDRTNEIRMRAEIAEVVKELHDKISAIRSKVYLKPPGKVVRSRRQYVFLSHNSADLDKVQAVREALESAGIKDWSFIDSVRTGTGKEEEMMEVPEMIASAKAVIIVLTDKWRKSDSCTKELEMAANHSRRCIWLRFENVDPLGTDASPELIDLREPDWLAEGLQELIKTLRRSRSSADQR